MLLDGAKKESLEGLMKDLREERRDGAIECARGSACNGLRKGWRARGSARDRVRDDRERV